MKENAFVIGKTTMPVSIQDVKGDVVTFNGKSEVFTYTIDGKVPYDLCYASITGAEYALGTPTAVEGMDRTYKVPATITFFATDGENLVYTYDVIASESEKIKLQSLVFITASTKTVSYHTQSLRLIQST